MTDNNLTAASDNTPSSNPSNKNISSNPMSNLWNIPQNSLNEAVKISANFKTAHGMFAGVPLICQDDRCPYKDVCMVDKQFRIVGQRCLMEASAIVTRFEDWCKHFNIDISSGRIKEADMVDVSLIRDLVDNEIQMLRAENKLALSADFIGKVVTTVDKRGKAYYTDAISPEAEYKLLLLDKRYKIFNLLNSTRKDKENELKKLGHPSVRAASIIKKIKDMGLEDLDSVVVDVEFKEEKEETK